MSKRKLFGLIVACGMGVQISSCAAAIAEATWEASLDALLSSVVTQWFPLNVNVVGDDA